MSTQARLESGDTDLVHEAAAASNHVHGPTFALREQDVASTDGGHIDDVGGILTLDVSSLPLRGHLALAVARYKDTVSADLSNKRLLDELEETALTKMARLEDRHSRDAKKTTDAIVATRALIESIESMERRIQ